MYKFELPLNERTKRIISIEEIFTRFDNQISLFGPFSEFTCFRLFFNICTVASRSDIKIEITQELNKLIAKKTLNKKTKKNLDQINKLITTRKALLKANIPQGSFFGDDQFLQEIRTASLTPAGIVGIDLPQLQQWSQKVNAKNKKKYFKEKIAPYRPIFTAITDYLTIMRDSITLKNMSTNDDGLLSYPLNTLHKNDLVQIQIPNKFNVYPNLTSNKYLINVQFNSFARKIRVKKTVQFKLGISQQ